MHALLNVAVMGARRAGARLIKKMPTSRSSKSRRKGITITLVKQIWRQKRPLSTAFSSITLTMPSTPRKAAFRAIGHRLDHRSARRHDQLPARLSGFCVSIGVQVNGRLRHGVVYDPMRQELFTASRGEGAQLDGHKIRVSGRSELDRALIGTGFPVSRHVDRNSALPADARQGRAQHVRRAPPRFGRTGSRLRRSRTSRRVSGRLGSSPGTWRRAA